MIPFEYLEHTADIKFRAYGQTPQQMLANAYPLLENVHACQPFALGDA